MTVYVGLTGEAGAGKDVTGNLLVEESKGEARLFSFAAPLYELAIALVGENIRDRKGKEVPRLFSITQNQLEIMHDVYKYYDLDVYKDFPEAWSEFVDKHIGSYMCHSWKSEDYCGLNISPRRLLELIGSGLGRDILNSDIWIEVLDREIKRVNPAVAIITDVRFDNEAELVYKYGGYVIKVECPNNRDGTLSTHDSTKGVTNKYIAALLTNTKEGLEEYRPSVQLVYKAFIEGRF